MVLRYNAYYMENISDIPLSPKKLKEQYYVDPEKFKQAIKEYYKDGECKEYLGDCLNKIAEGLGYNPKFINYCVDEETEALTKRGWLKYDQITLDDKILSYDVNTKNLVWSNIIDVFVGHHNDLMFKLTNIGLDALVTPNHKFVSLENGIKPIEEFRTDDHLVLMGSHVSDENQTEKYSNEFVELVGWAVTEGNYLLGKRTNSVQIFQKEGEKADRIRNILRLLKEDYKEYNWTNPEIKCFRIKGNTANQIVKKAANKIVSMDFILDLTQSQRMLLIETMISGDGWRRNSIKNKTNWSYCQQNKEHVDNFIALCTIAGLSTSTHFNTKLRGFTKNPYYIVNIFLEPKRACFFENVNMYGGRAKAGGNRRNGNTIPNTPTIPYDGAIWCPQTEYGTFVCRRGKYVYVTGNSYKEDMIGDALVKMFSALKRKKFNVDSETSPFGYFTTIAFHAFINRIKKEKKHHDTLVEYRQRKYEEEMSSSEGHIYVKPILDSTEEELVLE
jgi:hypothetical protein